MDCSEFSENIYRFIDESLSDEVKSEMLEHSRTCPTCKKELDDTVKMIGYLRSMPRVKAPDNFTENVNRRIDAERPVWKRFLNYRTCSALAACVLCFVIIRVSPQIMSYRNTDIMSNSADKAEVLQQPTGTEEYRRDENTDGEYTGGAAEETEVNSDGSGKNNKEKSEKEFSRSTVAVAPQETPYAPADVISGQQSETAVEDKAAVTEKSTEPVKTEDAQAALTDTSRIQETPETAAEFYSVPKSDKEEKTYENKEIEPQAAAAPTPAEVSKGMRMFGNAGGGGGGGSAAVSSSPFIYGSESEYHISVDEKDLPKIKKLLTSFGGTEEMGHYLLPGEATDDFFDSLDENNIEYSKTVISNSQSEYTVIYMN